MQSLLFKKKTYWVFTSSQNLQLSANNSLQALRKRRLARYLCLHKTGSINSANKIIRRRRKTGGQQGQPLQKQRASPEKTLSHFEKF